MKTSPKTRPNKPPQHPQVQMKFEPGEGRNPERAYQVDRDMMAELRRSVALCEQMLILNHKSIEQISQLLNMSQPALSGKIEVRWWKTSPRGPSPVVTIWDKVKGSPIAIAPVRLKRKASRRSAFKRNYEETQSLLGILEEIMANRAALLKYNGDYKRLISRFSKSHHAILTKLHSLNIFDESEKRIIRNNILANKKLL